MKSLIDPINSFSILYEDLGIIASVHVVDALRIQFELWKRNQLFLTLGFRWTKIDVLNSDKWRSYLVSQLPLIIEANWKVFSRNSEINSAIDYIVTTK